MPLDNQYLYLVIDALKLQVKIMKSKEVPMDEKRHLAMFWTPLSNGKIKCELCPHSCIISPHQTGRCRARINIDGILYTENFGKIVSYGYDPIEKKPLKCYESGSMIFSIGTFGCNFSCEFCQNHELVYFEGPVEEADDDLILSLAQKNQSIGIAYTYNESSVWYEYVYHMAKRVHANGLRNVLVTNGFISEQPLLQLLPYIDAMNIDLKAMTPDFYQNICHGALAPVMESIKLCHGKTHVEVTYLLIDGLNTHEDEIEHMAKWLASIDPNIPLHLTRYFPNYHLDIPMTSYETIQKASAIARTYLKHVFNGNVY